MASNEASPAGVRQGRTARFMCRSLTADPYSKPPLTRKLAGMAKDVAGFSEINETDRLPSHWVRRDTGRLNQTVYWIVIVTVQVR